MTSRSVVGQTPWVQRSFTFGLETGLFPAILERLRGTPARLEERLRAVPPADRVARVGGSWSIQEHAGHLLDLEELGERRLRDFRTGAETLTAADMSNRKTEEAGHNDLDGEALLAAFRRARADLVAGLEGLDPDVLARPALHPRLRTPMTVVDWAWFMAEHDDHHLARIGALAAELTGGPDAESGPAATPGPPAVGAVAWRDLTVEDAQAVRDFYCRVVGWTAEPVDMGDWADFNMRPPGGGDPVAGICHARGANAGLPAAWLLYMVVADLDESLAACRALGGEALGEPRGHGAARYAVIRDPAGAVCVLYQAG